MKLRTGCSLFILGTTLIGCHQHDHYLPPPVNIPREFPSFSQVYKNTSDLPYNSWWQKLHDPQLDNLVESGLKNNLDLQITFNNLERAQGQLLQVKLNWLPTLSILAGYSTNPALGVPGAFVGAWPTYAINIAQQINQQKRAKYNVQYYQSMVGGARLAVIGQITSTYLLLIAQKEQLRLLQQLDRDAKELLQISQKEIGAGLKNTIDLAEFQVQIQQIEAQMSTIKYNIVAGQNALRFLINDNPGAVFSSDQFKNINLFQFKPGALPVAVLRNRPDVQMAIYAVQGAGAAVSLAYSDFFPLLQLDDFLGSASAYRPNFIQAVDAYPNWTIALSTLGKIKAQKAAQKASINEYIKTVRSVLKNVDNDFSAHRQTTKYYSSVQTAERYYRKKHDLQRGLLKTGLTSYTELLNSKVTLDNLELLTNQAKLQLALSLVNLYQDLAAGYKTGN